MNWTSREFEERMNQAERTAEKIRQSEAYMDRCIEAHPEIKADLERVDMARKEGLIQMSDEEFATYRSKAIELYL